MNLRTKKYSETMNLRNNNMATDNESENKNINIVANAAFKKATIQENN